MNLLSASPVLGIVWSVLLFAACFVLVHIARLVRLGWKYQAKEKPDPAQNEKTPAAPQKSEQ